MKIYPAILVFLFVALILPLSAYSANVTSNGTVSRIYLAGSGAVRFKLSDDACDLVHTNHYYELTQDHASFEESYTLLVASAYSNKAISVRHDDAACSANIGATDVIYVLQNF